MLVDSVMCLNVVSSHETAAHVSLAAGSCHVRGSTSTRLVETEADGVAGNTSTRTRVICFTVRVSDTCAVFAHITMNTYRVCMPTASYKPVI